MNENDFAAQLDVLIFRAMKEDLGNGDITTSAIFSAGDKSTGEFIVKQDGIIAGLSIVEKVFHFVDRTIIFNKMVEDGDSVSAGDVIGKVSGTASAILAAERTALNFLQRMSGIATATNQYVLLIEGTKAKILDTRKTVPGLRVLDKLAVKIGGGQNHRSTLSELFLIKDNHIQVAGSLTKAVQRCISYRDENFQGIKIEVEAESLEQVREAMNLPVDIIMLDNLSIEDTREAVALIGGKCKTEASGGVTLDTVRNIALTGVDYISVGALTHSVLALDISLELQINY